MKDSFGSDVDTDDVNTALENLLRLEIYYKEFNYEEIQEIPAYTVYYGSSVLPKRRKIIADLLIV